jgi:hypothetical protein
MTNYWLKRQYAEVSTEPDGLSKRGYVYSIGEFFTINATTTVYFGMGTNGVDVEFQFYDITSDTQPVEARLIEAPATATAGTNTIVPRNLNRHFPDASTVTLSNYTAVTGGIVVASELVGLGSKAGGFISQSKIHVLKAETLYIMAFYNTGNQATKVHLNLGWAENQPNEPGLWETVP